MNQATTLSDLRAGPVVVSLAGKAILLWAEDGRVFAVDNRCPHLGFPMLKGSLKDGILTCHWHQWRFDACGGGCLTDGGTDIATYAVEIRGDAVFVDPRPRGDAMAGHWRVFEEGMREASTTKIARSVVALVDAGTPDLELVRRGALHGAAFRDSWSSGQTILACLANILASLDLPREDRVLALVTGLRAVAGDCQDQPPPPPVEPLPDSESLPPDRLARWFRQFVEQRDGMAAKRCILTMIEKKTPPRDLADAFLAALTDHVWLEGGHALDFAEKAFELLDRIGWKHAAAILPSLCSGLAGARRSEEDSDWRIPADLIGMMNALENKTSAPAPAEALLSDDPARALDACAASTPGAEDRLAAAALTRLARFHVRNEFFDWDAVHHAFTYAAAARRFVARSSGGLPRARALAHGAMAVYLVRFLNMPAAPLPASSDPVEKLAPSIGRKDVDGAARAAASGDKDLWRLLAHAFLIEDNAFHTVQAFEACLGLARELPGESRTAAIALARWLAAHSPTNRTLDQAVTAAIRLGRGDKLYEE